MSRTSNTLTLSIEPPEPSVRVSSATRLNSLDTAQ